MKESARPGWIFIAVAVSSLRGVAAAALEEDGEAGADVLRQPPERRIEGVLLTGTGGPVRRDDAVAVDGARLDAGEDLALGEVGQEVAAAPGEVPPAGCVVAAVGDVDAVRQALAL